MEEVRIIRPWFSGSFPFNTSKKRLKKAHAKPGAAPEHHWVFALPQLHIAVLQSLLGKTTSWRDRETQKDLCNMEIHGIPKGLMLQRVK